MKAKTSQSFFPTDTKHVGKPTCNNYIVMRKATQKMHQDHSNKEENTQNIFRTSISHGFYTFDHTKEKPVGGMDTFLKYKHSKKHKMYSLKSSNEQLKKQFSKVKGKDQKGIKQNIVEVQRQDPHEQVFKRHHDYSVSSPKKNSRMERPVTSSSYSKKHDEWAKSQSMNYHNKMAFLNEIYYKKPLNERYGDRYFEYMLRNRHEDDLPPPPYIYQIRDDTFNEIENDKFIKKLRKSNPGLKNRRKLVIKGNSKC